MLFDYEDVNSRWCIPNSDDERVKFNWLLLMSLIERLNEDVNQMNFKWIKLCKKFFIV